MIKKKRYVFILNVEEVFRKEVKLGHQNSEEPGRQTCLFKANLAKNKWKSCNYFVTGIQYKMFYKYISSFKDVNLKISFEIAIFPVDVSSLCDSTTVTMIGDRSPPVYSIFFRRWLFWGLLRLFQILGDMKLIYYCHDSKSALV